MKIQEQVPLAPLTTLGIGGPARWFTAVQTEEEVRDAVSWAQERGMALFVLGGGSNLLIADQGFPGLTIHIRIGGVDRDSCLYRVGAGESWDGWVQHTVEQGCAGVECLAGIPGTVGGTPVQNVGAYGQEVSQTIETVRVLDLKTIQFREMSAAACGFAYRASIFNRTHRGRFIVTRVDFRLKAGGGPELRYGDLQREFAAHPKPQLVEVAAAVRRIRRAKGMLLVDGDADCRSAGSFFKNPVLAATVLRDLEAKLGIALPAYPAGEGLVKIPAAWLIEQAGFGRGYRLSRAGISSRHTLALVNIGKATAQEMLALRDVIVAGVYKAFGITLEMEPVLVGF